VSERKDEKEEIEEVNEWNCKEHRDEEYRYLCLTHKIIICAKCLAVSHKKCLF
jgi:hypothetical protein